MNVIFIRHGQSEANVKQEINCDRKRIVHLTELGKKQAIAAGKKLKRKKIDVIYCSPFTRTKETAALINESLGKKIVIDGDLKEMNTGLEGENITKYKEVRAKSGKSRFDFKRMGKESFRDVALRIERFLKKLEKKDYDCVLCVTHEASLMVLGYIFGEKSEDQAATRRFENCAIVEFEV
jgi:broad specificity phosphatase PhoE